MGLCSHLFATIGFSCATSLAAAAAAAAAKSLQSCPTLCDPIDGLNIQKTKIMASGPITSWQIGGETVETVRDFILGYAKAGLSLRSPPGNPRASTPITRA